MKSEMEAYAKSCREAGINGTAISELSAKLNANLVRANLDGANLDGANRLFYAHIPERGAFVVVKATEKHIVWLAVPEHAKRTSSIVGRKCRVSEATVLSIEMPDGTPALEGTVAMSRTLGTRFAVISYRVGETVFPDSYDPDPRVECTHGIYVFVTRNEAHEFADWPAPPYEQPTA